MVFGRHFWVAASSRVYNRIMLKGELESLIAAQDFVRDMPLTPAQWAVIEGRIRVIVDHIQKGPDRVKRKAP